MSQKVDQRSAIEKAIGKHVDELFSRSEPQVANSSNDGVDIFLPFGSATRRVHLHGRAKEACGNHVLNVGSMSVKTHDENGNPQRRISCSPPYNVVVMDRPHWWSIGFAELNSEDAAQAAVAKLCEGNSPVFCAVMADLEKYLSNKDSKAAYKAFEEFVVPARGIQVDGITRKRSPRYNLTKLVIFYEPSGAPTAPDTVWSNALVEGGAQNSTAANAAVMEVIEQINE
jgi:hypothetical protein